MGIYDRDYYRDEPGGFQFRKPGTVIGWIILINVVVFLADGFLTNDGKHPVNDLLAVRAGDLVAPWYWWRFLTYGFCHASFPTIGHIVGNMLGLFFLGQAIEQRYGSKEFLRLYIALILFAGIAWATSNWLQGSAGATAVGASGAVVGIVVLFALNYPRRTVMFMMLFPMPAWVVGVIVVANDLYLALAVRTGSCIAFEAHLAGAALAYLYWRGNWNFTRLTDAVTSSRLFDRRPRLRVHRPEDDLEDDTAMSAEEDRILEKISREGEGSLTRKERRILQKASRRLQEKHRRSTSDD